MPRIMHQAYTLVFTMLLGSITPAHSAEPKKSGNILNITIIAISSVPGTMAYLEKDGETIAGCSTSSPKKISPATTSPDNTDSNSRCELHTTAKVGEEFMVKCCSGDKVTTKILKIEGDTANIKEGCKI